VTWVGCVGSFSTRFSLIGMVGERRGLDFHVTQVTQTTIGPQTPVISRLVSEKWVAGRFASEPRHECSSKISSRTRWPRRPDWISSCRACRPRTSGLPSHDAGVASEASRFQPSSWLDIQGVQIDRDALAQGSKRRFQLIEP
jgi:hypothetical protein